MEDRTDRPAIRRVDRWSSRRDYSTWPVGSASTPPPTGTMQCAAWAVMQRCRRIDTRFSSTVSCADRAEQNAGSRTGNDRSGPWCSDRLWRRRNCRLAQRAGVAVTSTCSRKCGEHGKVGSMAGPHGIDEAIRAAASPSWSEARSGRAREILTLLADGEPHGIGSIQRVLHPIDDVPVDLGHRPKVEVPSGGDVERIVTSSSSDHRSLPARVGGDRGARRSHHARPGRRGRQPTVLRVEPSATRTESAGKMRQVRVGV